LLYAKFIAKAILGIMTVVKLKYDIAHVHENKQK